MLILNIFNERHNYVNDSKKKVLKENAPLAFGQKITVHHQRKHTSQFMAGLHLMYVFAIGLVCTLIQFT